MTAALWYRWEGADLLLQLRVQPRADRDELAGVQDGRLRVRLTAPPADGKANARLCRLMAELFQVSRSSVLLVTGASGRDKRLRIQAPRRLLPDIERPAAAAPLSAR